MIDNAKQPNRKLKLRWIFLAFIAALSMVLFVAMMWYPPVWNHWVLASTDPFYTQQDDRVDLNTATVEQLTVLPGIGEKKALAIIEYRDLYGDIEGPEDLAEVPGIGPKILENLEPFVRYK